MKALNRVLRWFVVGVVLLWVGPKLCFATIEPDKIGVRQSNVSGVYAEDLGPGWVLRIPGIHKVIEVPRRFEFLDYTGDDMGPQEPLQIRTQDNNIVMVDVSVPYHIKPGEGHLVVEAGNHVEDRSGLLRVQRLAEETTVSVLREHLAELTSADWYDSERRLAVATVSLDALNASLADLHVEAEVVLVRAVTFRDEYERQLQQIQLNEQNKLLDGAREKVATKQQALDNFVQGTKAQASSREQGWKTKIARLEGAYQVGFVDTAGDTAPGAARRALAAMEPAAREVLVAKAAEALGIDAALVDDSYLLGIQNIQAETLEYDQRVRTQAEGLSLRLTAEGEATLAKVRGAFETRINALLDSAAGRAYVAYQAADNVKFAETLVFRSSDGIPTVLRLRALTEAFMGL